jgi:hypothetical protein
MRAMKLSITRRGLRIALGLVWLLDGALQFQSFMYSRGFLTEVIEPSAMMQPAWIGRSIVSAAHFAGHDLALWNTLFGLVQVSIGLGLLYRRTARPALLASFGWALVVWWFGEGLGMIPADMASPLTGAPGAVLLYGLIGLLLWPAREETEREGVSPSAQHPWRRRSRAPEGVSAGGTAGGGLIGERGGLLVWSALWLTATVLWCLSVNRAPAAISEALKGAAPQSMHWLATLQSSLAHTANGHGAAIATVLAVLSLAIAAGVWTRFRGAALVAGAVLSLAYWVLGQSLGAINTGHATDPNAGPLFVLLALTLMPRRGVRSTSASSARRAAPRAVTRGQPRPIGYKGLDGPTIQQNPRSQMTGVKWRYTWAGGQRRGPLDGAAPSGGVRPSRPWSVAGWRSRSRWAAGRWSRSRWAAFAAITAVAASALGASGCGGSSAATTEARVTIKPMATWDAISSAQTASSMKGMSASQMKSMSTASGGMPYVATSAHGEAELKQEGDHLTGWRRVWGLVPYSSHANHLHGPDGACSPASKQVSNMAVVLPDLTANAKGEAYGAINLIVHQRVVGPGYFLVIHQKPTPADQRSQIGSAPASMAFMQAMSNDPAILCGDVTVKS